MPDLEKVIRGLECRHDNLTCKDCEHCPYGTKVVRRLGCDFVRLCGEALELLKEQPVEAKVTGLETQWYRCGACEYPIDYGDKFCRHCGRPVRWDE